MLFMHGKVEFCFKDCFELKTGSQIFKKLKTILSNDSVCKTVNFYP